MRDPATGKRNSPQPKIVGQKSAKARFSQLLSFLQQLTRLSTLMI
jgi:hypothetical protein